MVSLRILLLLVFSLQISTLQLHKTYPIAPLPSADPQPPPKPPEPQNSWSSSAKSFWKSLGNSFVRFKVLLSNNLMNTNPGSGVTAGFRFFWLLIMACVTILVLCLLLNWLLVFTKLSRLELNQIERDEKMMISTDN